MFAGDLSSQREMYRQPKVGFCLSVHTWGTYRTRFASGLPPSSRRTMRYDTRWDRGGGICVLDSRDAISACAIEVNRGKGKW